MDNYRSMIPSFPAPILVVDDMLEVVQASRSVYAVFNARYMPGMEEQNLKSLSSLVLDRKDLTSPMGAATIRLKKPGSSERFRWENGDRSFEVVVSPLPVVDGATEYTVFFEEKTDQIAMQRSSARVRSYLESIMASLHLGIIVTDRKMQVTNMNRTQESFLKDTGSEISSLQAIGMPLPSLFPDEKEILEEVAPEVLESGSVYAGIVERYDSGEKDIVFSVSFSPLRDESGEIMGMIRVCEDITEKQRLEAELHVAEVKAREAEAIRRVVITLKHEINNALMTIIGNVEVLLRTGEPLPEDKQVLLRNVLEWADRIASVTKRLEELDEVKTVEYLENGPEMIDTGNG